MKASEIKNTITILEDRLAGICFELDKKQDERIAVKREIDRLQVELLERDPYP